MANQFFTYQLDEEHSLDACVGTVKQFLELSEKMETQCTADDAQTYIMLQGRTRSGQYKQLLGMDKAMTVRFKKEPSNKVIIEIGEAKWADKGAVMALSLLGAWPLAITSGFGIYQQKMLPGKIKTVLDEFFGVSEAIQYAGNITSWRCPDCGADNTGKFCAECGAKQPALVPAEAEIWACPECGTENRGKFCAECGRGRPI